MGGDEQPRASSGASRAARAWADALAAGWLPVIAVNAVFVRRVPVQFDAAHQLAHHFYDAAQLLGLAALSWLAVHALCRMPSAPRIGAAFALVALSTYALLPLDLESFLERHEGTTVPWRAVFALAGTLALALTTAAGWWLGRGKLRFIGILLGLALAVGNHLVLELNYPGAHFVLAWAASLLIGTGVMRDLAARELPRSLRIAAAATALVSLVSYAFVPGPIVRSALLSSSGAVVAPFVTQVWAALEGERPATEARYDAAWFSPREGLPAVPAVRLPKAPEQPIVILLTVDALRADLFDGSPAERKAVRNMRAIARRGLSFSRAWAPAPYTMGSLRSLFLGVHYFQQNRRLRDAKGKKRPLPSIAALLDAHGVATLNVRIVRSLDIEGSVTRGFKQEVELDRKRHTATDVVSAILEQLDADAQGSRLIYAHIIDPHSPYTIGAQRGPHKTPKQRYLAEVAHVDKAIGKLYAELVERGLQSRTYLIVSADHAEAFGEHGHYFHATTVYEEMIHVPLILQGPGIAVRSVDTPVTLLDVSPTVLSLFGVDTPGHFMGQSLVPFMRGESPQLTRPLAVDGGRAIRAMLFEGRWKAIVNVRRGTEELYDLANDPKERKNLAEEPEARAYFATLRAFFKTAKVK
jgi:hypothetical protein